MKIILVAIHPYPSPQAVPLANAFLKSSLAGVERTFSAVDLQLFDFFLDDDTDASVAALLDGRPDAVGFSTYAWNRESCTRMAVALRQHQPLLTIFAGGPEPTADPEGVMRDAPLDFLIMGEGEITFVEVVECLIHGRTVAGVPGVGLREGDAVVAKLREPVEELDRIPSPYLGGFLPPDHHGGVLWQLSRGCDFACSFCFDQKALHGVRRFSRQRLAEELQWFVKNRISQVFVLDSTFNREMKQAKEMLALIAKVAPHIHFHFEVRSEFIDPEMARLFARLNCSLQVGLQSADPAVHRRVRRVFNPGDFITKVTMLNEAGAIFGFDLIYGLPGDSLRGFEKSLDFALALYPNHLDIFPLAVLPGTDLATRADALGLDHLPGPPYTIRSTPDLSAEDMAEAGRLAAACDIFYSRGKAVAWFNSVLVPLQLMPSAFLSGFSYWLTSRYGREVVEADIPDEEVWQAQRGYISHLFSKGALKKLLPAALDQIDYHYHFAAALTAPQPELPTDRELARWDLLKGRFVLAPGARLATFNYEIVDLLEAGEIDLREFTRCFSPSRSWGVIYPRGDEIYTESLIEPHFRLLQLLQERKNAEEIAGEVGIPVAEAISFMEFASAEGIVQRLVE